MLGFCFHLFLVPFPSAFGHMISPLPALCSIHCPFLVSISNLSLLTFMLQITPLRTAFPFRYSFSTRKPAWWHTSHSSSNPHSALMPASVWLLIYIRNLLFPLPHITSDHREAMLYRVEVRERTIFWLLALWLSRYLSSFSYLYWTCFNGNLQCSYIPSIFTRLSSGFCVQKINSTLPQQCQLCPPILDHFLVAKHFCLSHISSLPLLAIRLMYLRRFFVLDSLLPKEKKHIIWHWPGSCRKIKYVFFMSSGVFPIIPYWRRSLVASTLTGMGYESIVKVFFRR